MKLNHLALSIVLIIGFTSCSSDGDSDSGSITKANIANAVNLYDDGITAIDNSGMTVSVEGTSPKISATTDANGSFVLADVPFGTYTLVYEKASFGTFKRYNVVHQNGNTIIPDEPSLGQKSTTAITNLTVGSSSSFVAIIGATTSPEGNQDNTRYIRYFFSTDPNVSKDNYDSVLETFPVNISPYNLNISQATIDALGFPSGATIYVKCYGESFWGNNYTDEDLGTDVFPNLNSNSAAAVSFVVP